MSAVDGALFAAACVFVIFVAVQGVLPAITRRGPRREAHARLAAALELGHDAARPAAERAEALREASLLALHDLRRPRLALRYAREADEAEPGDARSIRAFADAMIRARRYRPLERYLWLTLDTQRATEAQDAAWEALLSLYEGPMRAPERARVLRALRS